MGKILGFVTDDSLIGLSYGNNATRLSVAEATKKLLKFIDDGFTSFIIGIGDDKIRPLAETVVDLRRDSKNNVTVELAVTADSPIKEKWFDSLIFGADRIMPLDSYQNNLDENSYLLNSYVIKSADFIVAVTP